MFAFETVKSKPNLFPPKALQLAGEVLAFGEGKYPNSEWKGMSSDTHLSAVWRHMLEHQAGNTNDSESQRLHLVHALVRLAMAVEQHVTQ